jgi:hypothetical protein
MTPRLTGRLTVGRKVTSTSTYEPNLEKAVSRMGDWRLMFASLRNLEPEKR